MSEKKAKSKKEKKKPIRYTHIDTFLQSAIPIFKISKVQAQGFKARMNGRHYQKDEKVFVDELKQYLNIK